MPSLPPSSSTSASSRPEPGELFAWHPSRQQQAVLAMLTAGAVLAVLNCALPAVAAFPVAAVVAVRGGCLVVREGRRPPLSLELAPGRAEVDGARVAAVAVEWRGPLAFLRWRDAAGRVHRRTWWPDVLPPRDRRRLRLAAGNESASPVVASVAP